MWYTSSREEIHSWLHRSQRSWKGNVQLCLRCAKGNVKWWKMTWKLSWGMQTPITKNDFFPFKSPLVKPDPLLHPDIPWSRALCGKASGGQPCFWKYHDLHLHWIKFIILERIGKSFIFASIYLSSLLNLLNHQALFIQVTNDRAM